jgi:beta-glucosidase
MYSFRSFYLFLGCLLSAVCFFNASAGAADRKELPVYLDLTQPIEARISDALQRMTLDEKVALCHAQSRFTSPGVPRLGIPGIHYSDGPHGVREELVWSDWTPAGWTNDSCTAFPALTCLAATFNPQVAGDYGVALGEEARYRNKDVILGPGVNIYRVPLNGRNVEYLGEDPYLASRMAVAYIRGVQQNGVAACVKHFALNNQETNRTLVHVEVSDRALHEIYLPAFKAAVQQGGVWTLMGSYNRFRGQYCSHNDLLINQILKKKWGFDGGVVSDWGATHDTFQAALNGLDVEMGSDTVDKKTGKRTPYYGFYLADPFLKAIREGKIPESVVNDKASRVLRLIFRTSMSSDRPFGRFVCPEHSEVARHIAKEGIVLLKNEQQLLPLQPGKTGRIAVIGENSGCSLTKGGGSS